jgi:prefoldin subunit 5
MSELDTLSDGLVQSVKAAIERAIAPHQKRIAELETIQRDLLQRLDKHGSTLESLERRASRHADHLGSLETRTKTLERQ